MFAVLVMTDGRRDCISQAVPSMKQLDGLITRRVIHDDSGDPHYREWLRQEFPDWQLVTTRQRAGFTAAVINARRYLRENTSEPFVFATEDDFVFDRKVDLYAIADVLTLRPWLAQMVLLRQAWNEAERAAGGIVEQHPDAFEDRSWGGLDWLEHRRYWSTNPSLFRRSLLDVEWPAVAGSEGWFTHRLLEDGYAGVAAEDVRFGLWGARADGPWVTHVGHQRVGMGY